jgi:mannose-6-phosphate isomerase-like protein (cupin superfamily)
MEAFEFEALRSTRHDLDQPYLEFLRHASLSAGLYALPAGGVDRQVSHSEDELYYVVSGRGVINVAGEDRAVQSGSIIYVGAAVEHFFHLISEELLILVFFAPAEGSNRRDLV